MIEPTESTESEARVQELLRLANNLEDAARQWQRDFTGKNHQRAQSRLNDARRELEAGIRRLVTFSGW